MYKAVLNSTARIRCAAKGSDPGCLEPTRSVCLENAAADPDSRDLLQERICHRTEAHYTFGITMVAENTERTRGHHDRSPVRPAGSQATEG
jgi:hypothetical protein